MARIERNWLTTGFCWPLAGSTIAAKPRPIALPITSPATVRGGKADQDREAEREPGHHLAADQDEAGEGGEAVRRQGEAGDAERRNADRKRDHEAQLDRHEIGAEDRRGEEGGAGADHRDHPQPELVFDPREPRGDHRTISGMRAKDFRGEIGDQHHDRAAENGEADGDHDQLRHEGQRLLVDRGRRLEHAEDQAGDERRDQDRRRRRAPGSRAPAARRR